MGSEFVNSKFGSVVAIPFGVANATTNQANVDLAMIGGNTLAIMPFAGSVIGLGVRASAEVTAGGATFKVHKDSSEIVQNGGIASVAIAANTDTTAVDDLETQGSCRPGVMKFSAGDGIGVSYSSTTTMAPTNTVDFDAVLFVMLDA